eukprot:jgi/Tetstr1/448335/TSEL_035619.t1
MGSGRHPLFRLSTGFFAILALHVLFLPQRATGMVSGLSVTSIEDSKRCYDSVLSLRTELPLVVRPFTQEAGEDSEAIAAVRDFHMPYTTKYCKERDQRMLELRPDGCLLDPFEPAELLRLIRGRRLVVWGDSTQRQFFSYLSARLEQHALGSPNITMRAHYGLTRGCEVLESPDRHTGVLLTRPCFEAARANWRKHCHNYPGGTSLCFVRNDRHVVDPQNVVFYNDLRESDIVLANVGLHHNTPEGLAQDLRGFAKLLSYQSKSGRRMPLWLWRDTSPQHFKGGLGGNYPEEKSDRLRHVVPGEFRCTRYPLDVMRRTDWRNRVLMQEGLEAFEHYHVPMPFLRVWNLTAMLPGKHPQTLGTTRVADCTHHCPGYGGVYELWSVLFYNFLSAALRHESELRIPIPHRSLGVEWQYPPLELTLKKGEWMSAEEIAATPSEDAEQESEEGEGEEQVEGDEAGTEEGLLGDHAGAHTRSSSNAWLLKSWTKFDSL